MINSRFAYDFVYEEILKSIENGELKDGKFLLSEKEYCQKFDLSLTTIRRALEKLQGEGIVEKIKGKGTVINNKVRRIRRVPNRYIGMLMLSFSEQIEEEQHKTAYVNMYAHNIYKSIFNELSSEYNLLIDTIVENEIEKKFPYSILSQVDDIFIVGETRRHVVEYLHSQGKCLVAYNYFEPDIMICRVNNDERKKFREVVEYFLSQGHRNIACINGINNFSESLERYLGYQDAMIMNDMYIDSRYVKWSDMTPEGGYVLTKELLALTPRPTCIVCVNDGVAMGAYDAIEEAGLKVGKDICLSGHDNAVFGDPKYKFTTIDPLYEQVGKLIAEKFKRTTWIDDETIQPCKLIIRNSE